MEIWEAFVPAVGGNGDSTALAAVRAAVRGRRSGPESR